MENKLLLFIYRDEKFLRYQIVNDNDSVRKAIDEYNEKNNNETARIITDEDVRQALFQKESLETVKSYVDTVRQDIETLRDDLNRSFDGLDYSCRDFYGKVKDYLNIDKKD